MRAINGLAVLIGLALVLGTVGAGHATDFYAAPADIGAGDCTDAANACDLQQAIAAWTAAGDNLLLTDGTYHIRGVPLGLGDCSSAANACLFVTLDDDCTSGSRCEFKAVNKHQVRFEWEGGTSFNSGILIEGDFWTVDGIVVDGNQTLWAPMRVLGNGSNSNAESDGVIVQNVRILDAGHTCFVQASTNNLTVRWSYCPGSGYSGPGEAFYLGSSTTGVGDVDNADIYENIVGNHTDNFVDYKNMVTNSDVHHNIGFNYTFRDADDNSLDGMIRSSGTNATAGNKFRDNILIQTINNPLYVVRTQGQRVNMTNNALADITASGGVLVDSRTSPSATIFGGHILHNSPSTINATVDETPANTPLASQEAFDAEVDRILSEATGLIGGFDAIDIASCECGAINATTLAINWNNPDFPPLSQVTNANIALVGSVTGAFTENSSIIQGTNQTRTTLASACQAGETLTVTPAYDAVRNSSGFGGEINLRSPAGGGTVCTNNVGGAVATRSQTDAAFLPWEAAANSTDWRGGSALTTSTIRPGGCVRAVFQWECDPASPVNCDAEGYQLYASKNGGAYAALTTTCAADGACLGTNPVVAHLTSTVRRLAVPATFTAGAFVELASVPAVALNIGQATENEYPICVGASVVATNTFDLQIWREASATALDTYDAGKTPRLTVATPFLTRSGGGNITGGLRIE